MPKNNLVLLDTHAFVWLINGDTRIKKAHAFTTLTNASKVSGLRISVISTWEIAMLVAKKKIVLNADIHDWIDQALQAPGLICEPVTPRIAVNSTCLPGMFHGDPADRIIVATARHLQCPIVTADKKILSYSKEGFVKTIEL
jgi:PIN domain nuclease of toxin-antitoxin system